MQHSEELTSVRKAQSNLAWVCNRFACLFVERVRSLCESVTEQQTPYTAVAILIRVTMHNHDRNAWLRRINWQAMIDLFSSAVYVCVCVSALHFLTVSISIVQKKVRFFPSLCDSVLCHCACWRSHVPLSVRRGLTSQCRRSKQNVRNDLIIINAFLMRRMPLWYTCEAQLDSSAVHQ